MGSNHNTFLRGLETAQVGWHAAGTIDATAAAADAVFDATERDYDTAVALDNAVAYKVPPEINILEVRVILPVDGDDAIIDIWARRSGDANLVKVCKLTCKGGAVTYGTQSPGSTNVFCDTQTVAEATGWRTTPVTYVATTDHMARTEIYTFGFSDFVFHGHTAGFDGDADIEVSGRNSALV
jgi:hypothetical protein